MDKKTLAREYRESRRPTGVYQIRNTMNGKLRRGMKPATRVVARGAS